MSLSRIGNPLNIHGLREVEGSIPPHFTKFQFVRYADERLIKSWVYTNLTGRFFFNTASTIDGKNTIAFENPGDATIFALSLTTFNKSVIW